MRELAKSTDFQIIDAGANVGQFGVDMRKAGFYGQIFSYEPVSESFRQLEKTIGSFQPWKAFQLALGSAESKMEINISGNSGLSSSILEMKEIHLRNFPESRTVAKELVCVSTINRQVESLCLNPQNILLKIDVQGYELQVLNGADEYLNQIPFCFLEVSLKPLYENESSLLDLLNLLAKYGHEVTEVFRGVKSKRGELLQLDVLTKKIS